MLPSPPEALPLPEGFLKLMHYQPPPVTDQISHNLSPIKKNKQTTSPLKCLDSSIKANLFLNVQVEQNLRQQRLYSEYK